MSIYKTTVYGLKIEVDYDYNPGFPGSKLSPPEEPELEVHEWRFADEDSEQMFASYDRCEQTTIIRDIQDYVDGGLFFDIAERETRLKREDWIRHRTILARRREIFAKSRVNA